MMFSIAFIFEAREYDDEFHRLDAQIGAAARSAAGFRGAESYREADGARRIAIYYWDTLKQLAAFSRHPVHLEAKQQYRRWYSGYHIVIAQVLRSYGDGGFAHITPNERASDGAG